MVSQSHDYRECEIPDCQECQALVDDGFVMACDKCHQPGSKDSLGWHGTENGGVYCAHCWDAKSQTCTG